MRFTPVWKHPRALAEQTLGFAVLGGVAWWWLGLAESGIFNTLLSAAAVLSIVCGFVILAIRARRQLAAGSPLADMLVSLGLFLVCTLAGYGLLCWVPGFESFAMQAVSMAVRFTLAWSLVLAAWLNLLASTGRADAAS